MFKKKKFKIVIDSPSICPSTWYIFEYDPKTKEYSKQVFRGYLEACEAWLRLNKKGYIK